MFNNNLSSLWNIKIMYFGAKFWHQTLRRGFKFSAKQSQRSKWKISWSHKHSRPIKSLLAFHRMSKINSLDFVMQPSDWLFIFGGVHLHFPQIKNTKKIWTKKTNGGPKKTNKWRQKSPKKDQMLGENLENPSHSVYNLSGHVRHTFWPLCPFSRSRSNRMPQLSTIYYWCV